MNNLRLQEVKSFTQKIVVGKVTFEFKTAFLVITARWNWPPPELRSCIYFCENTTVFVLLWQNLILLLYFKGSNH